MNIDTSTPLMQRQQMLAMDPGRLYWCITDEGSQSDRLCYQLLSDSSQYKKMYYISSKKKDALVCKLPHHHHVLRSLHYFELSAMSKAYLRLPKDLLKTLVFKKDRLIIIRTSASIWHSLSDKKIFRCLQNFMDILSYEHATILLISEGEKARALEARLSLFKTQLGGLCKLQQRLEQLYFMSNWWKLRETLHQGRSWAISATDKGFEINPQTQGHIQANMEFDEDSVYANQRTVEVAGLITQQWQLLPNNKALMENAINTKLATLIFAFSGSNDVFELAKQIYHARVKGGEGVKIVVRKCTKDFRHIDMQILLNCGANMVIPYEVHFSAFLVMLRSLKGNQFLRSIPNDIDDFLRRTHLEAHKGEVPFSTFCRQVKRRSTMPLFVNNDKGILIAMLPSMGISPQQAAQSCQIKRRGDIYSYADDKLVLFLSMCGTSDVDRLLSNIFPNVLKSLFIRYDVLSSDHAIMDYLSRHEHLGEVDEFALCQVNQQSQSQDLSESGVINPIPKPHVLNLEGV